MKKMILIASLALTSFFVTAQNKPYFNVGANISSGVVGYSAELGADTYNARYAVVANTFTASPENTWALGAKGYWKIANRIYLNSVDLFATGAVTVDLNSGHGLTVDPGIAAVFNLGKNFAPQFSVSFPFRENTVFEDRPIGIRAGISLNIR